MPSRHPGVSRSVQVLEAQDEVFGTTKKRRSILKASEALLRKAKALEERKADLLGKFLL